MDRWLGPLRTEIEAATEKLSEAEWIRAPEGRWNASEIIEHMARTYGSTAKMLELHMAAGTPQIRPAGTAQTLKRIVVVDLGFFPGGAQAPFQVLPQGATGPEARKRALENLDRMERAIDAAELRWGTEGPIGTHVILGPLSGWQWRKFHYLHGRLHLRQLGRRLTGR